MFNSLLSISQIYVSHVYSCVLGSTVYCFVCAVASTIMIRLRLQEQVDFTFLQIQIANDKRGLPNVVNRPNPAMVPASTSSLLYVSLTTGFSHSDFSPLSPNDCPHGAFLAHSRPRQRQGSRHLPTQLQPSNVP
jgi:hypothetical protein